MKRLFYSFLLLASVLFPLSSCEKDEGASAQYLEGTYDIQILEFQMALYTNEKQDGKFYGCYDLLSKTQTVKDLITGDEYTETLNNISVDSIIDNGDLGFFRRYIFHKEGKVQIIRSMSYFEGLANDYWDAEDYAELNNVLHDYSNNVLHDYSIKKGVLTISLLGLSDSYDIKTNSGKTLKLELAKSSLKLLEEITADDLHLGKGQKVVFDFSRATYSKQ